MSLASKLEQRRKQLNMTLLEVATKVGVTESTVQRWESGSIKTLRHERIVKLAEVLDVTPAYLMGWDDEQPPSVSAEGLSEIKRDLIEKIMAMDDETVAALNRIADQVLSLRDK